MGEETYAGLDVELLLGVKALLLSPIHREG